MPEKIDREPLATFIFAGAPCFRGIPIDRPMVPSISTLGWVSPWSGQRHERDLHGIGFVNALNLR